MSLLVCLTNRSPRDLISEIEIEFEEVRKAASNASFRTHPCLRAYPPPPKY